MPKKPSENITTITERFISSVCSRLTQNKKVRRALPYYGRLHIDRQLPFLCVYRKPEGKEDWGTDRLPLTTASYLLASSAKKHRRGLSSLVANLAETMIDDFGAFLILEIWSGPEQPFLHPEQTPTFRILHRRHLPPESTLDTLTDALEKLRIPGSRSRYRVTCETTSKIAPPQSAPLLSPAHVRELGCSVIGLEVPPIYRSAGDAEQFPAILKRMRRNFYQVVQRTFFEFTRSETNKRPKNFHVLGRRAVVKAVWTVDRMLAEVSGSFDFLLLSTPTNTEREWSRFQRRKYEQAPRFQYRPQPFDPMLIKRQLFGCPIEQIEDPTLTSMFSQMQQELELKLTMLSNRDTKRFHYGSLQVFGTVSEQLAKAALGLLSSLPIRSREKGGGKRLHVEDFARLADQEVAYYRKQFPEMAARVEIHRDLPGLMVSSGNLLVGSIAPLSELRAKALIQHEVGTHILTYYNAVAQPFHTLRIGLPGYEELQEGLAVLSEYLIGGLDGARLRLLAARVVAVKAMINGASFVEVFRLLRSEYGFSGRASFYMAMRVFRGGGLTKDAVYLKGLMRLLNYLGDGGEFRPLLVGKVDIDHIPLIKELQTRKIVKPILLHPRYFDEADVQQRLARVKTGLSIMDLTKGNPK